MDDSRRAAPLILILDADDDERVDLYSFLDRQGYLVATRTHPLDAFKYACEHKPAIVVLGGPSPASQCRAVVQQIQTISPGTRILVLRTQDDSFALCDLAADPRVSVLRQFNRDEPFRDRLGEILRKFSRSFPLSA